MGFRISALRIEGLRVLGSAFGKGSKSNVDS